MTSWRIRKCYNVYEVYISFTCWLCTVYRIDVAQGLRGSETTGKTHSTPFYVTTWKVKLILCGVIW